MHRKKIFRILLSFLAIFLLYINGLFAQGDTCESALTLPNLVNYKSAPDAFNNIGANLTKYSNPSCWKYSGNEVWFKFTAIGTDVDITVTGKTDSTVTGTLLNPEVTLYNLVNPCDFLTPHQSVCGVQKGKYNVVSIYNGGLKPGKEYYIQVNGSNQGTFGLLIDNYNPPPSPSSDCITANTLTTSFDPVNIPTFAGGAGKDNMEAAGTCINPDSKDIFAEKNTVWYKWICKSSGSLTFTLTPADTADDIDFVLFLLPDGQCSQKVMLRCDASGYTGPTGMSMTAKNYTEEGGTGKGQNNFVKNINMVEGETYALMIENFSSKGAIKNVFGGTGSFLGTLSKFDLSDSNSVVCDTSTYITLVNKSENANIYSWTFGKDANIQSSNLKTPPPIKYNTFGEKTIFLQAQKGNGKPAYSTKVIYVRPNPAFYIKDYDCSGYATLSSSFQDSLNKYSWSTGATSDSITVKKPVSYSRNDIKSDNYSLQLVDRYGCKSANSIAVKGIVNLIDTTVADGNSMTLDPGSYGTGYSYKWSTGEKTQTISVKDPGDYTVSVTYDSTGCSTENKWNIFTVTNVITPNGDGKNDYLVIKSPNPDAHRRLTIIDRWGRKIYSSENYLNNWNAKDNTEGTYFYILELPDGRSTKGIITVVK
ncbi:MAG: gliding motility-associated C-terminal domain-containing protein [Bacteroidota bacterium]|nr:gliding motility-associated C-terminal domain-containing protein [Bacteroidota bacterium]